MPCLIGGRWFATRLEESRRPGPAKGGRRTATRVGVCAAAQYVADLRQVPRVPSLVSNALAHELLVRHRPRPGEEDLREFAWYHLWRRCHHGAPDAPGSSRRMSIPWSSPRSGDLLASAGKDGTVSDLGHLELATVLGNIEASSTEVNVAAFSPDGNDPRDRR